jgi:hypothetical protein
MACLLLRVAQVVKNYYVIRRGDLRNEKGPRECDFKKEVKQE